MIKDVLEKIINKQDLSSTESENIADMLTSGMVSDCEAAALLMGLEVKGITAEELTGFVKNMRSKSLKVNAPHGAIDMCGTGGGTIKTFNVSTLSSFVVAASGIAVAKHGNRSVTSACGSADVIEFDSEGIQPALEKIEKMFEYARFAFLFAPYFHPSMKHVVPIRKALGIKTIFNLAGPLTNPAGVKRQVLGVYNMELVNLMAKVLSVLGTEKALVVHGTCGLDEISVCGPTIIAEVNNHEIHTCKIHPEDIGLPCYGPEKITVNSKEEALAVFQRFIDGKLLTAEIDMISANAGAGIYTAGKASSLEKGVFMAKEIIQEQKYIEPYNKYMEILKRD